MKYLLLLTSIFFSGCATKDNVSPPYADPASDKNYATLSASPKASPDVYLKFVDDVWAKKDVLGLYEPMGTYKVFVQPGFRKITATCISERAQAYIKWLHFDVFFQLKAGSEYRITCTNSSLGMVSISITENGEPVVFTLTEKE